ncbi:Autophagocytosis associated protein, active-site domain [compost metagenome]
MFGYDENGQPLSTQKILEDIHTDYSNKTVTIEQHPHLSTAHASIHPCKHADVMKKMVDRMSEEGRYVRVDLYLYIFLKVISAVIPTIDYDHTIQVQVANK